MYYFYQNKKLNTEINNQSQNIKKVKEKIDLNTNEKSEKTNQYEKLKEEHKQELEELNVWEEMEKELKQSLS